MRVTDILINLAVVKTCDIHRYQTITLYILNIHYVICQLHLNKADKENEGFIVSEEGNEAGRENLFSKWILVEHLLCASGVW